MNSFFYARNARIFYTLWILSVFYVSIMISSETPYKLAEIIRDTWPNLYRPNKVNTSKPIDDKRKIR